jgi:hypothetical protein
MAMGPWQWHMALGGYNLGKKKRCKYILPPSRKECNCGIRASQSITSLTKFIANTINIYVSK